MSVYATMSGELIFNSREKFEQAKTLLEEGGWVNNGDWMDEAGGKHGPYTDGMMKITIPPICHRNLLNVIDHLVSFASFYDVLWASTDGMFEGGLISSGGNKTVDLNAWASENGLERPDRMEDDDGCMSEEAVAWQEDVVRAFMDAPGDF